MAASFRKVQCVGVTAVLATVSTLMLLTTSRANGDAAGVEVKPVRVETLANVPGKTLTVVTVNHAPGAKSWKHRHAGSVFAYVTTARLKMLTELFDAGSLHTNIGEVLPLREARTAHEMLEGALHRRGKIVLKVPINNDEQ